MWNDDYVLECELEAYTEQIKYGLDKNRAALFISSNYGLMIEQDEALKLLEDRRINDI